MPVEPVDPDDLAHDSQDEPVDEEENVTVPTEVPIESPEADVLEQRSEVEEADDYDEP